MKTPTLEELAMYGGGMTREQAKLWAASCEAQRHYTALRDNYADPRLVAEAKKMVDQASAAYAQSMRGAP